MRFGVTTKMVPAVSIRLVFIETLIESAPSGEGAPKCSGTVIGGLPNQNEIPI